MPSKAKKHEILGGVKVSASQLSKWGKLGGRPKQYLNSAERARAFRLRKKQLAQGKEATLRNYCSYEDQPVNSLVRLICQKCGAKSIGSVKAFKSAVWILFSRKYAGRENKCYKKSGE
jgi:hypothetical protein